MCVDCSSEERSAGAGRGRAGSGPDLSGTLPGTDRAGGDATFPAQPGRQYVCLFVCMCMCLYVCACYPYICACVVHVCMYVCLISEF